MLVVLRDLGLEIYIKEDAPKSADERRRTDEETKTITEWEAKDAKARTRIELAIRDSEMIHISGATTAKQMWDQIVMVKESKG